MKNVKQIVICSACLVAGVAAGMGGMYGIQRKNIKFAKENSLLMEVQSILKDSGKNDPVGGDPEKAAAKGYMSQFDKFTRYVDKDDSKESSEDLPYDVEAKLINGNVLYIDLNGFVSGTNMNLNRMNFMHK